MHAQVAQRVVVHRSSPPRNGVAPARPRTSCRSRSARSRTQRRGGGRWREAWITMEISWEPRPGSFGAQAAIGSVISGWPARRTSAAPARSGCARACASSTSAEQHLLEARLHHAGHDVLPAVGLQHRGADLLALRVGEARARDGDEVVGIGGGLRLQDAVDGADQGDQVVDRGVALRPRRASRPRAPLQLVEHRVLRLVLPVEQEDVLPQRSERLSCGSMLAR